MTSEGELVKEERDFYKSLAKELIKSSISRIESNASSTLSVVTLIATLYAAIVGFWVTSQNALTPIGSVLLAIPEILLILSVGFVASAIIPIQLTKVSILSPNTTYESYSDIVKSKTSKMKWSFGLLILALISMLIVMLSLTLFRDDLLQAVTSALA